MPLEICGGGDGVRSSSSRILFSRSVAAADDALLVSILD